MSHTPHTERGAEIMAALMKAPRTIEQLCDAIGVDPLSACGRRSVTAWLRAYQRSGVVRIGGYRRLQGRGLRPAVYELQRELFAQPDLTRREAA